MVGSIALHRQGYKVGNPLVPSTNMRSVAADLQIRTSGGSQGFHRVSRSSWNDNEWNDNTLPLGDPQNSEVQSFRNKRIQIQKKKKKIQILLRGQLPGPELRIILKIQPLERSKCSHTLSLSTCFPTETELIAGLELRMDVSGHHLFRILITWM